MRYIYIISDSVGETGENVVKAVIKQFNEEFMIKKFPYINLSRNVGFIIEKAKKDDAIVVFTTVVDDIRNSIIDNCEKLNVPYIDIMVSLIDGFKKFLNSEPKKRAGIIRKLDKEYFDKIKAIEFAVKYDDGKDTRGIKLADIVVLGISRTSKTPLCMVLANKMIKACNIPVVPEIELPKELYEINPKRIVVLKTSVDILRKIREQRAISLGLSENSPYASLDRINMEIEYCKKIATTLGANIIDVSDKAVEETANIISIILDEIENR